MTLEFAIIPPFLQDTTNNEATTSLTLDNDMLYSCGTYPPKFAQYSLSKHSTLFYRHVEHDILKFNVLSSSDSSSSKYALLMANRNIQFHTLSKCIYSTKLPGIATEMQYSKFHTHLYFAGNDFYALNLTTGQFLPSINHQLSRISAIHQHPGHLLMALGGSDAAQGGVLNMLDPRSQSVVASLTMNTALSACQFSQDGFHLATGDFNGNVCVYDTRQHAPLHSNIIHQYSSPIKEIRHIVGSGESYWASLCQHQMKLSNTTDGSVAATVEPGHVLNDFVHIPESGVFIMAGDSSELTTVYIPDVGTAPPFALFMDQFNDTTNGTGNANTTEYEHYKFITRNELRKLGLDQFIGTDLLKPVMHGYYCHHRLIDTAKHVMLDYQNYKTTQLKQKVEDTIDNATVATGAAKATAVGSDDRFAALTMNSELYRVDEEADEYKRLKPTKSSKNKKVKATTKQRKYKDESDEEEVNAQAEIEENVGDMPTFEQQIQTMDVRGNMVYEFKNDQ